MKSIPALVLFLFLGLAGTARTQDYLVAAGVGEGDPYRRAAVVLARARSGAVVDFDPDDIKSFAAQLRERPPRWIAFVLRPEQIDFSLTRRLLQALTRLDDDPFVDTSYGFITGGTADEAVAFVERALAVERERAQQPLQRLTIAELGATNLAKSCSVRSYFPLRNSLVSMQRGLLADGKHFPETKRDRAFLRNFLPKLGGHAAVVFGGHGHPPEIVGGPQWSDLAGLDLSPAVVLNIACCTGVTCGYYEHDHGAGGILRHKRIDPARSFALGVLRAGAIGYVAYTSDRPAGPELYTDLSAMIADGRALGDVRRRDYDKVVLGYLGYGAKRLELAPLRVGARVQVRDAVRDLMLEGATGGVLYGDPALRPFRARENDAPVAVEVERSAAGTFSVSATVRTIHGFTHLSDQTTAWSPTEMAMRIHHRLPIGTRFVKSVRVVRVAAADTDLDTRLVWAFERDRGEHYAQLKVLFPRLKRPARITLQLRIETSADRRNAVMRHVESAPR